MAKYIKKPIEVEAFQLGVDYIPDWGMDNLTQNNIILHREYKVDCKDILSADIKTLEGTMKANHGDYIIKGVNGEIYPCKEDIFEKTYNLVDDGITELMKLRNLFAKAIANDEIIILYSMFNNELIETNIYYDKLGDMFSRYESMLDSNLEAENINLKIVEAVSTNSLPDWFSKSNQQLVSNRIFEKTGIRI